MLWITHYYLTVLHNEMWRSSGYDSFCFPFWNIEHSIENIPIVFAQGLQNILTGDQVNPTVPSCLSSQATFKHFWDQGKWQNQVRPMPDEVHKLFAYKEDKKMDHLNHLWAATEAEFYTRMLSNVTLLPFVANSFSCLMLFLCGSKSANM